MVDETAPEPMEERLPSSPTAAMPDDPASASIDEDRGDWRTDTRTDARADGGADALFDQVMDHAAPGPGPMDGLPALAARPADDVIAHAAAHDPATTALLPEPTRGGNARDHLQHN